jgi:nitrate/TMAO reductase-like tetraheme cytochrome c subunit
MKISNTKLFILLPIILLGVLIVFSGGYTWWNHANPEKTCASCHEISPAVTEWQHSAHRNFLCAECHGTAFSNGWHSMKEKVGMVFTHVSDHPENEQLGMNEEQVLEVMGRCANCHQREYARWSAGSHSTTYSEIFLNEDHNKME